VSNHLLDLPFLLQVTQCFPCKTAVDLESVHKGCNSDEAVGLNIFVKSIGGSFIENNCVVGLVLDWRR